MQVMTLPPSTQEVESMHDSVTSVPPTTGSCGDPLNSELKAGGSPLHPPGILFVVTFLFSGKLSCSF